MPNVREAIAKEIRRIKVEIDEQKKLVKNSVGNPLSVETAETEMKALHTRLSTLEANLAKLPAGNPD